MMKKKYGISAGSAPGGSSSTGGRSPFEVTFSEQGSLGLKLYSNPKMGTIDILGLNAGTQAERHASLVAAVADAGPSVPGCDQHLLTLSA